MLLVLLIAAALLHARSIVREHLVRWLCTETGNATEGGRCRPAPPPVIIHRDILRT